MIKNFPCPCCEYLTFNEEVPGSYNICPVCYWEDDKVQFYSSNYEGGANYMSLDQAKNNFKKYGAVSQEYIKYVRKPLDSEIP